MIELVSMSRIGLNVDDGFYLGFACTPKELHDVRVALAELEGHLWCKSAQLSGRDGGMVIGVANSPDAFREFEALRKKIFPHIVNPFPEDGKWLHLDITENPYSTFYKPEPGAGGVSDVHMMPLSDVVASGDTSWLECIDTENLPSRLQNCIDEEDYEQAAMIRDEIARRSKK